MLTLASYDVGGGAARAARRLHRGLLEQGVRAELGVRRKRSKDASVFPLDARPLARVTGAVRYLRNQWDIRREREGGTKRAGLFSHARGRVRIDWARLLAGYDIVHLHWVPELFDYGRFFAAVGPQQRLVWSLHDQNPFTGGCHYSGGCERYRETCGACPVLGSSDGEDLSSRLQSEKERGLAQLGDDQLTVVPASRWLQGASRSSRLLGRFAHQVIPYGIELDRFRPVDRERIRAGLGIAPEERVVLMVSGAQDDQRKGADLLSAALAKIRGRPGVCLLKVGSELKGRGMRTINLGEIGDEGRLRDAYNAADLLVAPSREDNLPLTVLESLACGTPVVAFDIGGMPDMIDPGETGLLARPEDSEDLARCIGELLRYRELGDAMRGRCRQLAERRYGLERHAQSYIDLYGQLLAQELQPAQAGTVPSDSLFNH